MRSTHPKRKHLIMTMTSARLQNAGAEQLEEWRRPPNPTGSGGWCVLIPRFDLAGINYGRCFLDQVCSVILGKMPVHSFYIVRSFAAIAKQNNCVFAVFSGRIICLRHTQETTRGILLDPKYISQPAQPTSQREASHLSFAKDDEYRRQLEDRLYPAVHEGRVVYDFHIHLGEPRSKPLWA